MLVVNEVVNPALCRIAWIADGIKFGMSVFLIPVFTKSHLKKPVIVSS